MLVTHKTKASLEHNYTDVNYVQIFVHFLKVDP